MNKHLGIFIAVITLSLIGIATVSIDLVVNHQLHVTNAVVGFVSILLALGFALPLELSKAIGAFSPLIEKVKPSDIINGG